MAFVDLVGGCPIVMSGRFTFPHNNSRYSKYRLGKGIIMMYKSELIRCLVVLSCHWSH